MTNTLVGMGVVVSSRIRSMQRNVFKLSNTTINCAYTVKYGSSFHTTSHGPLARYVQLRVALAPGMPGTFSPPLRVSDPDMHHGTCVTHVP